MSDSNQHKFSLSKSQSLKTEKFYSQQDWTRLRDTCNAICSARDTQHDYIIKIEQAVYESNNFRLCASQIQNKKIHLRIMREKIHQARRKLRAAQFRLSAFLDDECEREEGVKMTKMGILSDTNKNEFINAENAQLKLVLNSLSKELELRRRYLIYGMNTVFFPTDQIEPVFKKKCNCVTTDTIRGLHLPQVKARLGHFDTEIAAALGIVVILLDRLSRTLDVPLKYLCYFMGSKSVVQYRGSGEMFPLFNVNTRKHRDRFDSGMTLLNSCANQLRIAAGILTPERERLVENLQQFLQICLGQLRPKLNKSLTNTFSPLSAMVQLPKYKNLECDDDAVDKDETVKFRKNSTIMFVEKMTKNLTLNDENTQSVLDIISSRN